MKAYTTRGDGIAALALAERPDAAPGPTEVLVAMRAASLNYRDLLVVNGTEHWKPPVPRVPVSDGVGTVVAVGDAVTRVRVGDRVAGPFMPSWIDGELADATSGPALGGAALDGVLVERRTFDERAIVTVPDHLTDVEASTLPVAALTAWHALARRARVRAGETVLIQGTGGVSLFALQIAHALGARPIVTSSSDEKLARATAMGAAATINYRRTPAWEQEALALTDGRGVDHVVEVVGGESLNRSLEAVRTSGTISFIGLIAGLRAPIDTYRFVMRNVTIHGIETGSREMFEELNAFLAGHRIRPVVDATFPFDAFPDALRRLEAGAHFGKIGITF
jgi:NADPH:quinone reductase-like Zn-dependent oxidoreductase